MAVRTADTTTTSRFCSLMALGSFVVGHGLVPAIELATSRGLSQERPRVASADTPGKAKGVCRRQKKRAGRRRPARSRPASGALLACRLRRGALRGGGSFHQALRALLHPRDIFLGQLRLGLEVLGRAGRRGGDFHLLDSEIDRVAQQVRLHLEALLEALETELRHLCEGCAGLLGLGVKVVVRHGLILRLFVTARWRSAIPGKQASRNLFALQKDYSVDCT